MLRSLFPSALMRLHNPHVASATVATAAVAAARPTTLEVRWASSSSKGKKPSPPPKAALKTPKAPPKPRVPVGPTAAVPPAATASKAPGTCSAPQSTVSEEFDPKAPADVAVWRWSVFDELVLATRRILYGHEKYRVAQGQAGSATPGARGGAGHP